MSLSIVIWMLNFLALTMSVPLQNLANPPSNNKIEIPLDTQFETTTGRDFFPFLNNKTIMIYFKPIFKFPQIVLDILRKSV